MVGARSAPPTRCERRILALRVAPEALHAACGSEHDDAEAKVEDLAATREERNRGGRKAKKRLKAQRVEELEERAPRRRRGLGFRAFGGSEGVQTPQTISEARGPLARAAMGP